MTGSTLARRRTGWDVLLGILLILGGLVVLGNVALATAVSILIIGWTALISGLVLFVGAFFRIKTGGFWSAALGGAVLAVLGVFLLRNPVAGAASLTLLAGSLFAVAGITRLFASAQHPEGRAILIISGVISLLLGLWVLFNLSAATLTLIGILLGVQILVEGITLLLAGRVRPDGGSGS